MSTSFRTERVRKPVTRRLTRLTNARLTAARRIPGATGLAPPFVAWFDRPSGDTVTHHNGRVCLFVGWVFARSGGTVTVRAQVDGGRVVESTASDPRPDVSEVLADTFPVDPACGFSFYLDLPPLDATAVGVTVEFDDGAEVSRPLRFRVAPEPDLLDLDTYEGHSEAKHEVAARYLSGTGVEFGALHQPLAPDLDGCRFRYVDRLTRETALDTFPELRPHADEFIEPDFLIDLTTEDLSPLAPHGFDFFIANDVIEHLPNPLKFLRDVHDVMKPGALFFLSAPDRDCTFDARRELTTTEHLWREYQKGTTTVSRAHLREFVTNTTPEFASWSRKARRAFYEEQLERSIHVHVWDQASFDDFLDWAIYRLELQLDIAERVPSREAMGSMTYILRKLAN
jgi:SAM-dependent methyltransferase